MTTPKISLYFMGTDAFAAVILERLANDALFDVLGVVTPPDRPMGRKQVPTSCAVKARAEALGLLVFHEPEKVVGKAFDFLVVASYGHLLSAEILGAPKVAPVNVHGSLLPKYRGASPIQAALLHGDRVTGVSLQHMALQMDAGPVYSFSEQAIRPDHDASTLREEMAYLGAELVAQSLPGIRDGSIEALAQDVTRVSYSPKIDRESGRVLWADFSATEILNQLRAYTPWPGIFTTFKGKRLKILEAHVEPQSGPPGVTHDGGVFAREGRLCLERVQLEGKSDMSLAEFTRGNPDFEQALGSLERS